MNKTTTSIFLSSLLCVTAYAQTDRDQLARISKSFAERIDPEMPGWIHHSVEPIDGSKNVIIDQWELGDIVVKIAITQYDTQAESVQALKDFRYHLQREEEATVARGRKEFRLIREDLPSLGDGGLAWDVRGSEAVSFRKGNFLVFTSIVRPEPNTDSHFSKEFGRHLAEVLPTP